MDEQEMQELIEESLAAGQTMARLSSTERGVEAALAAFRAEDSDAFHGVLDQAGVLQWCHLACHWLCSKDCVIRCLRVAGPPQLDRLDLPGPEEFADVVAKVAGSESTMTRLMEVVEAEDGKAYGEMMEQLGLQRFAHLLCQWVCQVRCRLVCGWVCERDDSRADLVKELLEAGRAIRRLAASPDALKEAVAAVRADDCERLQRVLSRIGLSRYCIHICIWFCAWRCHHVCLTVCRRFFADGMTAPDDGEIAEFAKAVGALASERPEVLTDLVRALDRPDTDAFAKLVDEHGLQRYCVQLCHWLCSLRCRRFCICVCSPLIGRIDTPVEGACAHSTVVTTCTGGAGPLVGIEITGTAAGGGFDHYTLRYKWGASSPIETAVVYPDCSRPPAATGYSTPVFGGTLGWLDVTLLPPGVTTFTVLLDVFDSASGSVADTATFEVRTEAVEISAVATVESVEAEDPFHPGTFTKLVKATPNPSVLVPEQSVGGSFSVDGSAYVIGCDRILSQYGLVRFPAPPTSPPPVPADATGGTPLITAVPYEDVPAHPWQSGCFPVVTPNTIINGNLVSHWSTVSCTFLGSTYTVPKVRPVPNWSSGPSGRHVLLVEARDRPVAGPWSIGTVAAVDRVVVWVDNHVPIGVINSIGGIAGCGDVLLSNYVGGTATIQGVAWDAPIDASAPQQQPNDNFGSYSLSYKKNGQVAVFPIAGATPNTRVPNIWPGPLAPSDEGVLAEWDIVGDIDYTGGGPTPPGMLARGDRCAFVISLDVNDTTHVGDSGSNNHAPTFTYAITVINDL